MKVERIDTRGMKCPQPILKVATLSLPKDTMIEVESDCPNFETEIRIWCGRCDKALIFVRKLPDGVVAQIRW